MKNKVFENMIWRFCETMGAQIVSFIVSIILARLLVPEDYGIIAIIIVFINIANVFAESGLGTALIQKKEYDNKDFSTIFYFNIFFSLIIYFSLFLLSPIIARFYNNLEIIDLIRVLGLRIILSSVNTVQKAYVSKTMQFRKFFFSTLIGTVVSAIIGIILAYNGYGAWALVFQYLSNTIIDTVVLWFTVKWRPIRYFSIVRLKKLFSYGSKILSTSLMNEIFVQSKSLIIGKLYTSKDLAFFNKGQQFPATLTNGINITINSVMFPVMSKQQDSLLEVKKTLRKTVSNLSFFLLISMSILFILAPSLIPFLMTEKWIDCVKYLQITTVNNIFLILQSTYLESYKAIGNAMLFFKISFFQKVLNILGILVVMFLSPLAMLIVELFISILIFYITSRKVSSDLNYTFREQRNDILLISIICIISSIPAYLIIFVQFSYIVTMFLQVGIFCMILIFLCHIFNYKIYIELLSKFKENKNLRRIK